jgi:hypothetical protein
MRSRQSSVGVVVKVAAVAALVMISAAAAAEPPARLSLAMYAPSVPFADSSARAAYVRALARAIEARTGIPTSADSYADYRALVDSKPDLAILDAPCVVVRGGGALVTAAIGGRIDQAWGLYAREAGAVIALAGKRLAYLRTGCRDSDFLDHALLSGELETARFFGQLVGKSNLLGVIATVRDYRDADALFAPAGRAGGLVEIYAAARIPNPGLVVMRSGVDAAVIARVKEALLATSGESGSSATPRLIDGWREPASYAALAAQMAPHRKALVMAAPERLHLATDGLLPADDRSIPLRAMPLRRLFWSPPPPGAPASDRASAPGSRAAPLRPQVSPAQPAP